MPESPQIQQSQESQNPQNLPMQQNNNSRTGPTPHIHHLQPPPRVPNPQSHAQPPPHHQSQYQSADGPTNRVEEYLEDVHIVVEGNTPFRSSSQVVRKGGSGGNDYMGGGAEEQDYRIEVQQEDGSNIDVLLKFGLEREASQPQGCRARHRNTEHTTYPNSIRHQKIPNPTPNQPQNNPRPHNNTHIRTNSEVQSNNRYSYGQDKGKDSYVINYNNNQDAKNIVIKVNDRGVGDVEHVVSKIRGSGYGGNMGEPIEITQTHVIKITNNSQPKPHQHRPPNQPPNLSNKYTTNPYPDPKNNPNHNNTYNYNSNSRPTPQDQYQYQQYPPRHQQQQQYQYQYGNRYPRDDEERYASVRDAGGGHGGERYDQDRSYANNLNNGDMHQRTYQSILNYNKKYNTDLLTNLPSSPSPNPFTNSPNLNPNTNSLTRKQRSQRSFNTSYKTSNIRSNNPDASNISHSYNISNSNIQVEGTVDVAPVTYVNTSSNYYSNKMRDDQGRNYDDRDLGNVSHLTEQSYGGNVDGTNEDKYGGSNYFSNNRPSKQNKNNYIIIQDNQDTTQQPENSSNNPPNSTNTNMNKIQLIPNKSPKTPTNNTASPSNYTNINTNPNNTNANISANNSQTLKSPLRQKYDSIKIVEDVKGSKNGNRNTGIDKPKQLTDNYTTITYNSTKSPAAQPPPPVPQNTNNTSQTKPQPLTPKKSPQTPTPTQAQIPLAKQMSVQQQLEMQFNDQKQRDYGRQYGRGLKMKQRQELEPENQEDYQPEPQPQWEEQISYHSRTQRRYISHSPNVEQYRGEDHSHIHSNDDIKANGPQNGDAFRGLYREFTKKYNYNYKSTNGGRDNTHQYNQLQYQQQHQPLIITSTNPKKSPTPSNAPTPKNSPPTAIPNTNANINTPKNISNYSSNPNPNTNPNPNSINNSKKYPYDNSDGVSAYRNNYNSNINSNYNGQQNYQYNTHEQPAPIPNPNPPTKPSTPPMQKPPHPNPKLPNSTPPPKQASTQPSRQHEDSPQHQRSSSPQQQMQHHRTPPSPFIYATTGYHVSMTESSYVVGAAGNTCNFNNYNNNGSNVFSSGKSNGYNNSSEGNWPPSIKDIPAANSADRFGTANASMTFGSKNPQIQRQYINNANNQYNSINKNNYPNKIDTNYNTISTSNNVNNSIKNTNYNTKGSTNSGKIKNNSSVITNTYPYTSHSKKTVTFDDDGSMKKSRQSSQVKNPKIGSRPNPIAKPSNPIIVPMQKLPKAQAPSKPNPNSKKTTKTTIQVTPRQQTGRPASSIQKYNNQKERDTSVKSPQKLHTETSISYRTPVNINSANKDTKVIRIMLDTADQRFYTEYERRYQGPREQEERMRDSRNNSKSRQKDIFTINKDKYLEKLRRQQHQTSHSRQSRPRYSISSKTLQNKTFTHPNPHSPYNVLNSSHHNPYSLSPQCHQITTRLHTSRINKQPCPKYQHYQKTMNRLRMKQTLGEYQFIRRYLSDEEIFDLLDWYEKEGVPERKWPMRLIDEVYDKLRGMTSAEML